MKRVYLANALLLGITLIAASGCGSSNSSSNDVSNAKAATGGTSPPMTQSELTSKANHACKRINAKITYYSNLKPSNKQDLLSSEAALRATPHVVSVEHTAWTELTKLTPPPAIASDWNQIVTGVHELASDTQRYGEYIAAKNKNGIITVARSGASLLQRIHTLAARHGLSDCAKLQ